MLVDLDEGGLLEYRSAQTEPADFEAFWTKTLTQARAHPMVPRVEPARTPLTTLDVFDVTFPGFAGQPIKAWLLHPRGAARGELPTVVHFAGYGGGRGRPLERSQWASCGFANLVVDTRGQGDGWTRADTADPDGVAVGGGEPIARGLADPHDYYYRRFFTDAVRAVEAAATLDVVDPERIAVQGGSQGGGAALAAAGLLGAGFGPTPLPVVAATVAYAPFLCDFPRAVRITDEAPYSRIADFLRVHRDLADRALDTLRYVDGVNLARHAVAPAYFSAGLMDPIVPPSTVYGAYHAYAGPKEITAWPFARHEAGGVDDDEAAVAFFRRVLGG